MTKLCINCVHYLTPEFMFPQCARTKYQDPVEGGDKFIICALERQNVTGCCGPDAKFFEPVKTEVGA